jgi:RNA 3'-terminal phosphate cyclase (ATP)
MIEIDGSSGEGGGQVLRTSLALSIVTGKPFRIFNIRAGRKNPGLQPQHLASVKAAREICGGGVKGAERGSKELVFGPGSVKAGQYTFDVGTAGSTTLVLQTVLYPLMLADAESDVRILGGTHAAHAPPATFFRDTLLPQLQAMNANVQFTLLAMGFYPVGGGEIWSRIHPWSRPQAFFLEERGEVEVRAQAVVSRLPLSIAQRETGVLQKLLGLPSKDCSVDQCDTAGPGNVVMIHLRSAALTEVVSAFGKRHKPAEEVAEEAAWEAREYLEYAAPVGPHLADQLLLPMALGAGGSFVTGPITGHTQTNIDTIGRFLDVPIRVEKLEGRRNRITVG